MPPFSIIDANNFLFEAGYNLKRPEPKITMVTPWSGFCVTDTRMVPPMVWVIWEKHE